MNGRLPIPQHLYHYYEATVGPFVNLSDLPQAEAEIILEGIRRRKLIFAGERSSEYLTIRRALEEKVRAAFIRKGGEPTRRRPHYMTLGACPWLEEWYQDGRWLRLPLTAFDPKSVSFTYGDTFPAMRYDDGKTHRKQVYLMEDLSELINLYGLPQLWNPDGRRGPDRYIEAQIWDEGALKPFIQ